MNKNKGSIETSSLLQWIIPAVFSALLLFVAFRFTQIVFFSDDDYVLMACLNGTMTGKPSFFCSYTNPIFSYIISSLYCMTRKVNWYLIYHYTFLFLSATTIGRCILHVAVNKRISIWKAILIDIWFLTALLFYPFITISFTFTSAITCSSSVALILSLDFETDGKRTIIVSYVICVLFVFVALILRSLATLAVLCFLALAFAYQALKIYRIKMQFRVGELRSLLLCFLAVVLISGICTVAKSIEKNNYKEFNSFNLARSLYMDYPHLRYDEMPEEYEKLGMSEEFVYILDQWCFADEKVNTENLNTLVKYGGKEVERSLSKTLRLGGHLFKTNTFALSWILCGAGLVTLGFFAYRNREQVVEDYKLEFAVIVCAILGAFLQCFILCWVGRFNLQAFYSIAISCYATVILLLLKALHDGSFYSVFPSFIVKIRYSSILICILVASFFIVTCYKPVHFAFSSYIMEERKTSLEHVRKFYRYIMNHPENAYMYDAASKYDIDPFPEQIEESRSNAIAWGDSFYHSPIYDAQVASLGRKTFYLDALLDDNVYFISDPRQLSINGVLIYMCQEYEAVAMEVVDEIDDYLYVYKFHVLPVEENYTGWYKDYGNIYYFIKGRPQTGWFQVDGEKYFGIPMKTYTYKAKNNTYLDRQDDDENSSIYYYLDVKEDNCNPTVICSGYSLLHNGLVAIEDKTYYFDENGMVYKGWLYCDAIGWCYFDDDGVLLCSEWLQENGVKYYFSNRGSLLYIVPESSFNLLEAKLSLK